MVSTNRNIIACDIDNTVSNQKIRFLRNYDMKHKKLLPSAFNKDEILKDEPIKDAVECINQLSSHFIIVWVSARKMAWLDITRAWLKKNDFPYNEIHHVEQNDNKIPVLVKLNPLIFIDDMMYNWENLKPKECTEFKAKLKKKNISFEIFNNNWKEILKKIQKLTGTK